MNEKYRSLEMQFKLVEGQWQKKFRWSDVKLKDCADSLREGLEAGEKVLGWIAGDESPTKKSMMLVLTNKRLLVFVMFLRMDIKSIPLESITSVETSRSLWSSAVTGIIIKEVSRTTKIFCLPAEFAEKFVSTLNGAMGEAKRKVTAPVQLAVPTFDPVCQLEKLAELKAKGILTEEEFLAQKRRVLAA